MRVLQTVRPDRTPQPGPVLTVLPDPSRLEGGLSGASVEDTPLPRRLRFWPEYAAPPPRGSPALALTGYAAGYVNPIASNVHDVALIKTSMPVAPVRPSLSWLDVHYPPCVLRCGSSRTGLIIPKPSTIQLDQFRCFYPFDIKVCDQATVHGSARDDRTTAISQGRLRRFQPTGRP